MVKTQEREINLNAVAIKLGDSKQFPNVLRGKGGAGGVRKPVWSINGADVGPESAGNGIA